MPVRRIASAPFLLAIGALCGCDTKAPPAAKPGADAPPAAAPTASAPKPPAKGPRFEERAEKDGLSFRMMFLPPEQGEHFKVNLYDHGSGVVVADFDGDGRDDVYLLNQLGPNAMFRGKGDGTFEDVTLPAGDVSLEGLICVAAAAADADGDGDEDLYVTSTRGGNVLFVNDGRGRFRNATKDAGLTLVTESETPCFFDMDGDGDLDLLVTNTAHWTLDFYDRQYGYYAGKPTIEQVGDSPKEWNVLYRNDGKGRFTDVTREAGMEGKGWGSDVAAFDADGDGDLDVFVGNMFGACTLYANDGKGRFTDVTAATLGRTPFGAMGCRVFDYDGDGLLDLYVVDMHSDMWTPGEIDAASVRENRRYKRFLDPLIEMGRQTEAMEVAWEARNKVRPEGLYFGNALWRNLGGGKYEETAERANAELFWPWAIAAADFDADGFVDAYVPSGMGYPFMYWRSPLLHNKGDGTFQDVCESAGLEPPPGGRASPGLTIAGQPAARSNRAAATGDFDGDGRVDMVVNAFNDRAFLWRNVSPTRHFVELRLAGTKSGRDAIGAVVRLTAGGRTQVRMVESMGGYLSQSSRMLHFGLGDATSVDKVEIRWPSGATQTLAHVDVDKLTKVTEEAK